MKSKKTFISIIIIGITLIISNSCEKESINNNSIIKEKGVSQKAMDGDEGTTPQAPKYYQWRARCKEDIQTGEFFVGDICEGPFETPRSPSCNCPGKFYWLKDDQGNKIPCELESPYYPFDFPAYDDLTWNMEFTKEYIEDFWNMFEVLYQRSEIDYSPQELWEMAPHRSEANYVPEIFEPIQVAIIQEL